MARSSSLPEKFEFGALPHPPRITVKLNPMPNQTEARSGAAALNTVHFFTSLIAEIVMHIRAEDANKLVRLKSGVKGV